MATTKTTTLHGIVIPAAWNKDGDVTSVAIATYDEGNYLVEDNKKGRQLLPLLRKRVMVNGRLIRRDTRTVIAVDTFRQVKKSIRP